MEFEDKERPHETVKLPIVGITMGDAAGIGPEVILKALADETLRKICTPIIVGDLGFLKATANSLGLPLDLVRMAGNAVPDAEQIGVFDLCNLRDEVAVGIEAADTGRASAEYIVKAVELWRAGMIGAIATAPISKKALAMGGYDYPGHTEFVAELTGTEKFAMSFFAEGLRVVLLSTHVSLRKAIELVKTPALVDLIEFTSAQLTRLLGGKPKLAVAGLNPHASEDGMFGTEEFDQITPAIAICRDMGIDVSGPYAPDTVFLRGYKGDFDGVVACYHDQATIAVKSLSFGESVNVTLGLPLIRTSVDHGTAFDIAGKGMADASSMKAAIRLAAKLIKGS